MSDKTKEYYQQHATKEDIESLDDKLEHIASDIMTMRVSLENLNSNDKKLIAWTQRAGRMAKEFLTHFPNQSIKEE